MDQAVTHEIELTRGHVVPGKDGAPEVRHTRVVFGHRITAKELLALDNNPLAKVPTQRNDLILAAEITEFGSLKCPVAPSVLLDLDSLDREDLIKAQNEFAEKSSEGRTVVVTPNSATLAFGFKIDDIIYDHVEFGFRTTGRADVEADNLGLDGLSRECFLVGKQIKSIRNKDGSAVIDGPLDLKYFEQLEDAADVQVLRGAAYLWRQSFRGNGEDLSRNGRGPDSAAAGNTHRLERRSDSSVADRAAQ